MIVRSVRSLWGRPEDGAIDPGLADREAPDIAQRFLVVFSLAQDDAARHGVFAGRRTRTRAWDVRLYLAAGEEFEPDFWLVPSAKRLAREFSTKNR